MIELNFFNQIDTNSLKKTDIYRNHLMPDDILCLNIIYTSLSLRPFVMNDIVEGVVPPSKELDSLT